MVDVTLYTMPMCTMCGWIRTVLKQKGVKFTERNFLEHKLKNKLVMDSIFEAPVVEIGGHVMVSFDKDAIKNTQHPIAALIRGN